jgi:PAS domain S-box-containing protein
MDSDNRKTKVQLINELDAARQRLRELEKYSIVEKSNDGIVILRNGLIEFANAKASEIYGYSKADTDGKPFINFIAPQCRAQVAEYYRKRLLGENTPGTYETIIINQHGFQTPVEISASVVEYEGVAATLAVLRDISQRKKAESLVRESEQKFKTLAEKSPNMVFINKAGGIVYANPQCEEIMGYTIEELYDAGFNFMTLVAPENTESIRTNFAKHAAGKEVLPVEYTLITKNSGRIECILSTKLIDYEGAKAILGVVTDITESKKAEEILKLQAALLDAESDEVFLHDLEGNLLYVNKSACLSHGYTREELLTMKLSQLDTTEDARLIGTRMRETLKNGQAVFEVNHLRKNGTLIPLEVHASLINLHGKTMILGAAHDISERKKVQQQLMAQDRLASIGQLVSGIAHELNNPLTSVIGFSELLLEKQLPDELRADLKIINDEAKRTSTIVKNLLTFARQRPQEKYAVNINDPLQSVLQLRSHEQRVNNIKVSTSFGKNLPFTIGNHSQLQQVFFNIVTNAEFAMIESHQKGTLNISTRHNGDFIQAIITDDGHGISDDNMKHLFSPFFTTKQPGKGTGLGLSICQGIISEHGGRIWAESEPGKGATFFVELPACK